MIRHNINPNFFVLFALKRLNKKIELKEKCVGNWKPTFFAGTFHFIHLTSSRFGHIQRGHVDKHYLTVHQSDLCFLS